MCPEPLLFWNDIVECEHCQQEWRCNDERRGKGDDRVLQRAHNIKNLQRDAYDVANGAGQSDERGPGANLGDIRAVVTSAHGSISLAGLDSRSRRLLPARDRPRSGLRSPLSPLRVPPQLSFTPAPCSARSRMFSSILRIIQMSPNSNNAEKAMEGDSQRYRDRTRVMSRVDPSEWRSSCQ